MKKTRNKFREMMGLFGRILILLAILFTASSTSAKGTSNPAGQHKVQGDGPWEERSPQAKLDEIPLESMGPEGSVTTDLFNQMDQVSEWGIVSENFESPYGGWRAEAADDFIVPAADVSWTIESVDVIGFCRDLDFNPYDCNNLDNAEVNIYQDGGAVPGDYVYLANDNTITAGPLLSSNVRTYTINLTTPAVLPAGTYWISVAVDMDITAGDWLWNQRGIQNGNSFAWREGGNWGSGCTDWCSDYGINPDLNFRLRGAVANPYKVEIPTGYVIDLVEHGSQPLVYVSIKNESVVRVVNTETESIVTSIPICGADHLAISTNSSRVFVNDCNDISVINTDTNVVIDTLDNSLGRYDFAYGGPGRLYVSGGDYADDDIYSLDPSTGNLISTLPSHPYAGKFIAISPDGQTLCSSSRVGAYPTSLACYDISTDTPPAPWTKYDIGGQTTSLDISGDNQYVYITNTDSDLNAYNLSTLTLAWSVDWRGGPTSAYDSCQGDKVFFSGMTHSGVGSSYRGNAWAFDAHTHQATQYLDDHMVILLGGGKDNHTAYATNNDSQTLVIYHYTSFGDLSWFHWAKSFIEALYEEGLTSGYPDGTYRPQNQVTRAEMAVFLLGGMGISPPALDGSHPFSDISGHWAEAYIEELYDQGITGGYPDGTYRPQNQVTRAEMAIFLLKGIGVTPPPIDGSHPFSDIAGHWAEIFIEELYDQGITGGYPDGTYRPQNQVTRAEMAVFLVKTFDLPMP